MKRMVTKNVRFISIGIASLLIVLAAFPLVIPVRAVGPYGYKEGDTYVFTMKSSTSSDTEEGTASTSMATTLTYKIRNIDLNSGGYRIKLDYWLVTATGVGMGSSAPIIQEGTMEGDPEPFISYSTYGSTPRFFITTDWNTRGDEWNNYVNQVKAVNDWVVKDYTGTHGDTNGAFTINVEYDVSKANSHIDFNDDGTYDAYTGTMTTSIQYDANGVLSSFSMQSNVKFDSRNSETMTTSITRGSPSTLPSDALMLIAVGVVAFMVALGLGFYVGRGRRPIGMEPAGISHSQSSPPPPQ